jgi:hypothetical protein
VHGSAAARPALEHDPQAGLRIAEAEAEVVQTGDGRHDAQA